MNDPYNLQRFIDAQAAVFDAVRSELAQGHKRTHWMWFVFPQIRGLGSSEISRRFAISGREEATAYVSHPVLGARLKECTVLVNQVQERSARQIFGDPDCMKFQSSMTLFSRSASDNAVFLQALTKYFAGKADSRTFALLDQ